MSRKSDRARDAAIQAKAISKATGGGRRGEGTAKGKKWLDCHVCGRSMIVDGFTAQVTCAPKQMHLGIGARIEETMLA